MSEFVRSIHAAADRLAGQRGGDFSIRLILKPRGAAVGQFTLGWSSFIRLASRVCACCSTSAARSITLSVSAPSVNPKM
jgi:Ni,Fe-hydrogenase III large subunit